MGATIPQIGRIAIVQIDSTTQAYAQGYTLNEQVADTSEYVLEPSGVASTGWPAVSAVTTKSGSIDIDELYVDNTIHTKFELMAAVTVILGPAGSSGGNPKLTYTCLITKISVGVKAQNFTSMKVSLKITAVPTVSTW